MMSENIIHTSIVQELRAGKTITYFTVGVSMRPLLIERKTHVVIVPIENVKNGDILLYVRKNNNRVLHRCIKQDNDCYYMRGDNTYGLECIQKNQAIGIVTYIYRNGKMFDVKKSNIYKTYVIFWQLIYPLRWFVQKIRTVLKKIIHKFENLK